MMPDNPDNEAQQNVSLDDATAAIIRNPLSTNATQEISPIDNAVSDSDRKPLNSSAAPALRTKEIIREEARARLVKWLVWLFVGINVAVGLFVVMDSILIWKGKKETGDSKELLTLLISTNAAFVSGALGFYFNSSEP